MTQEQTNNFTAQATEEIKDLRETLQSIKGPAEEGIDNLFKVLGKEFPDTFPD